MAEILNFPRSSIARITPSGGRPVPPDHYQALMSALGSGPVSFHQSYLEASMSGVPARFQERVRANTIETYQKRLACLKSVYDAVKDIPDIDGFEIPHEKVQESFRVAEETNRILGLENP
jgi:hypothetical protein